MVICVVYVYLILQESILGFFNISIYYFFLKQNKKSKQKLLPSYTVSVNCERKSVCTHGAYMHKSK